MKFRRLSFKLSATAHILAWGAFLFLAFWPHFYQGTEATPVAPDGSGGEIVSVSASLIEVNGRWVLIPILVPVVLTGLALVTAWAWNGSRGVNRLLMWATAALLLVFCGLALFSLGIFYLPAALALLASAIIMSVGSDPAPRQSFEA